jgi:predicted small metal-binding protein
MPRFMIDCREAPSENNCTIAISGDDLPDLIDCIVAHAVTKHEHTDTPEFRSGLMTMLKPA